MILWCFFFQLVENRLHHCRGEFLGRESIPAADNGRAGGKRRSMRGKGLNDRRENVLIQRFACTARLLDPVEYCDLLDARRKSIDEVVDGKWTEEANFQQADILPLCIQVFHGLLSGFGAGAHDDENAVGGRRTDILKQFVVPSRQRREFVHLFLDDVGTGGIEGVDGLTSLKVHVGVLRGTAQDRMIGRECAPAVRLHQLVVDHGPHILVGELLDLHDFMRGSEPVEEMDERDPSFERGCLCDESIIHNLLNRVRREHCEPCGPGSHDVAVVAEDGECLGGKGPGGNMEHGGCQLAGDLEHIRDHQQETLRSREGGRERSGLQRTMHRSGRSPFALHLGDRRDCPPEVFSPLSRPLIGPFPHVRGGGDGVNCDDFTQFVSNIRGGFVAVDRDHFPFHHLRLDYRGIRRS